MRTFDLQAIHIMIRLLLIGGLIYTLYKISFPKIQAPHSEPIDDEDIEFTEYEEID